MSTVFDWQGSGGWLTQTCACLLVQTGFCKGLGEFRCWKTQTCESLVAAYLCLLFRTICRIIHCNGIHRRQKCCLGSQRTMPTWGCSNFSKIFFHFVSSSVWNNKSKRLTNRLYTFLQLINNICVQLLLKVLS